MLYAGKRQISVPSGAYFCENAIQFSAADTQYLTLTPSAGDDQTVWTFSVWIKRSKFGADQTLFSANPGSGAYQYIGFASDDRLDFIQFDGSSPIARRKTNQVFRDPTAWLHIVAIWNSASSDMELHVNGEEITSFLSSIDPSTSLASYINGNNAHAIARREDATNGYVDGCMTDIAFVDGQALGPDSFGEFDEYGVWRPIDVTKAGITWGDNGFLIQHASGADQSGNGNDFTPVNDPTDSSDVPTDNAKADLGNYARLNPLHSTATHGSSHTASTISEAGLLITMPGSSASPTAHYSTIPVPTSGKWYFEGTSVVEPGSIFYNFIAVGEPYPSGYDAQYRSNGAVPSGSTVWTAGDTVGCRIDCDAGEIQFVDKDGNDTGAAISFTPTGNQFVAFGSNGDQTAMIAKLRAGFGASGSFTHGLPAGFNPLCTAHLPKKDPVDPGTQIGMVLYTGDGVAAGSGGQSITGLGFEPDFLWIKDRDSTYDHRIFDSLRGATKKLATNLSTAEQTDTESLISFDSDGFTVGNDNGCNASGDAFVALGIGGLTHMTGGEISSLVSSTGADITPSAVAYDADLGFAIISWTGTGGASTTLPHPLGQAPGMVIVRSNLDNRDWLVYHDACTSGQNLKLNTMDAAGAVETGVFGSITSTLLTLEEGTTSAASINGYEDEMIAYLFADTDAIKVGAYTGNGSTDGPFEDLGGYPAFHVIKRLENTGSWFEHDPARHNDANEMTTYLRLNSYDAEAVSVAGLDAVAAGVKWRSSDGSFNTSGDTYIYLALLDTYFGGANVTQGKAR